MRVALLTPTFSQFSGIDRVVESEAERYALAGDEADIFALKAEMKPLHARLIVIGMPQRPFLEHIYRLLFFLDIIKIIRYVRMLSSYDLVVSYFYPMNVLASTSRIVNKTRYVYYNAGVAYPSVFRTPTERLYMHAFRMLSNLTVGNADEAVSISRFLAKELKRETGLSSTVSYVRINRKRFNRKTDLKGVNALKRKYKLKGPVFLYVGRISPHKGIHLLMKAFSLVRKEMPEAQLIIVGKTTVDSYSKELLKIGTAGTIFAGFVDDDTLPSYYHASDVYCTASLWEGFDMPAVEAQACGKPVVAFDLCSHPEVVHEGILVKPRDIQGFAKAMMSLAQQKIETATAFCPPFSSARAKNQQ